MNRVQRRVATTIWVFLIVGVYALLAWATGDLVQAALTLSLLAFVCLVPVLLASLFKRFLFWFSQLGDSE